MFLSGGVQRAWDASNGSHETRLRAAAQPMAGSKVRSGIVTQLELCTTTVPVPGRGVVVNFGTLAPDCVDCITYSTTFSRRSKVVKSWRRRCHAFRYVSTSAFYSPVVHRFCVPGEGMFSLDPNNTHEMLVRLPLALFPLWCTLCSTKKSVPISLLIMSRAFTLQAPDPARALAQSISAMDEDVVTEVSNRWIR